MNTRQFLAGFVAIAIAAGTSAFVGPGKPAPTTYKVDTQKSVLNWNGKKVTGEHSGTVGLQGGNMTVENGKLTGGKFVFDMKQHQKYGPDRRWLQR